MALYRHIMCKIGYTRPPMSENVLDFHGASRQLLRALRGQRSQLAFSRRLGFRSNVVAKWESGQRMPGAADVFRFSARVGIDMATVLGRFHLATAGEVSELSRVGLAAWLRAQQGTQRVQELATRSQLSRFSVGRMLSGVSEPRLPQFLALVEALTGRVADLVHEWVGIERVSALKPRFGRARAARAAMFQQPLCLAVMCLLDTQALACPLPQQVQLLAATLERPVAIVRECLSILERGGVVTLRKGSHRLTGALTVETKTNLEEENVARAYWTRLAADKALAPAGTDLHSYNVFSVSLADYQRLQKMQREFFRGARALIAASNPTDLAGLLVVHLSAWQPTRGG
jgi:hypothetical protein